MTTKLFSALLVLLCATGADAALRDRFPDLVKENAPTCLTGPPRTGVRITYMGTNAYLLEARETVVLVDPHFSRMSLLRSGVKLRPRGEPARVDRWLAGVPRIDGVLVTHGHIDHL